MKSTVRNITDTFVSEKTPTAKYGIKNKLQFAAAGAGEERLIYMYFAAPVDGTNVVKTELHFFTANDWNGSITVTAKRIGSNEKIHRLTYATKPGTLAGTATSGPRSNTTSGTEWVLDISGLMSTVASGGVWFGLELSVNGTATKKIHSSESSKASLRPYVVFETSEAPAQPSELSPGGGRAVSVNKPTLRYRFTDVSGDTNLVAHEIQIGSTEAITNGGTAEWQSGVLPTTIPELDLADTSYTGLTNGSTRWWRVRAQDGAGLWSPWSAAVPMRRVDFGSVVLNNPGASPNNFVADPTFPVGWATTPPVGETQRHFAITIRNALDYAEVYYSSGKITGTQTSFTIPELPAGTWRLDRTYNLLLEIWDSVDRQAEGGRKISIEVSRDFTFAVGSTPPAGVTGLTFAKDAASPKVNLTWQIGTPPDWFNVWRNNVLVGSQLIPNDLYVSGTTYTFADLMAPPREDNTWKVEAVVNGAKSAAASVTGQFNPISLWLSEDDGENAIILMNPSYDPERGEESAIHTTLASTAPVLVSQAVRGWEGHVTGTLVDGVIPVSAKEMRERFKRLRKQRGATLILHMVDEAFEVFIDQATYKPVADPYGVRYIVDFDFYQVNFS